MNLFQRTKRFEDSDLYVVITEQFCAGRPAVRVLDAVLKAGVSVVQLREKNLEDKWLYQLALEFRKRTLQAGALLLIDDRLDIALAVDADGVHLGQGDLPIQAARKAAPELIIGGSSHSLKQAQDIEKQGASYVNIGPIFMTQTKTLSIDALGPEAISQIAPHLGIPFTTMGGIKLHNIDQVLERGAKHVAVVTAVTAAEDITGAAKELRHAIQVRRSFEA